jgi:hypothetical protein
MLILVDRSYIYYEAFPHYVKDYLEYIISLCEKVIENNSLCVNIILGETSYTFDNNNRVIRIGINFEHTLVKKGGRGVSVSCAEGKVLTKTKDFYLVRIENYEYLNNCDIVIEYSIPNIYNIVVSQKFDIFSKKLLYLSPSIYEYDSNKQMCERTLCVLTTFINANEPRRYKLLENMRFRNVDHINVNDCFEKNKLRELYSKTKILINIHQTEHHHTFEEQRCLPALLCGTLVISEESPLSELIPYKDFIIWSSYEKILEKTEEVLKNYEFYHAKIFKNARVLSELHDNNLIKLKAKLLEL